MFRLIALTLSASLTLAACGAAGDPQPPVKPGIKLSGEAQVGVVIK